MTLRAFPSGSAGLSGTSAPSLRPARLRGSINGPLRGPSRGGVLLIDNFLSGTVGSRSVSEDLAGALADSGWHVTSASDQPGRLRRLAGMLGTAWKHRHQYSVAQVAVYSGPAFIWAEAVCWLLRLLKKPYVLTLHGGRLPQFARRGARRVRRLLETAVAVTAPSNYLHSEMNPFTPQPIIVLPNPLHIGAYHFRLRSAARPRLIWMRSFHEIYNPTLAVRVLARLASEFPECHLTMLGPSKGDGSLERTLQMATALGVAHRMQCPGAIPKGAVPESLNTGDIFLNTTNVDNTPVSVLEAMTCGLCVVSTNVGGIPYVLEHERDALLVPPDSADAMAAAVQRLLNDPELARFLSVNARRKAERFGWSELLPRWERLLQTAVSAHHADQGSTHE
jgi:glycosyltransferase involved in cell wall biosynthesis